MLAGDDLLSAPSSSAADDDTTREYDDHRQAGSIAPSFYFSVPFAIMLHHRSSQSSSHLFIYEFILRKEVRPSSRSAMPASQSCQPT
jgi:hypothetical protein